MSHRSRNKAAVVVLFWGAVLSIGRAAASQDLSWWRIPEPQAQTKKSATNPVDINQATMEELMKVPGMSRVWATRIMRFRPYSNKYSLKLEGVLPGDAYERLKPYLVAHREK